MAETQVLKACAINRNVSPGASSAKSHAQLSGPHPVVQVNMTANGPQTQGNQAARAGSGVAIMPPKRAAAPNSDLPVVQVNMTASGPQVQRRAAPATSQPRIIARGPAPRAASVAVPESLSADQLMLCRHLVDKYLSELRTPAEGSVEGSVDAESSADAESTTVNNVKLAAATLSAIDVAMIARTTAEAAVLTAEAEAAAAPPLAAAAKPLPRVMVGPRSVQAGTVTPRRVSRPAPPPVVVKMDGERPVVQDSPPPETSPSDLQGLIDDNAPQA